MRGTRSLVVRALGGFAHFWWDFFIGDTPEIFVAVLVSVGAIAIISLVGGWHALGGVVLTLLCITALASTLWRAKRSSLKGR